MAEEIKNEEMELEETILAERKSLEYDAKDDDLANAIDSAIKEAKPLKEVLDKIGKRNETYWRKGTDIDQKTIHPKRAKIVDNRIFMSVETILPMLTSKTPEPMLSGEMDNDVREKITKVLTIAYEVKQKLQQKLQMVIRHWFLYRIGVWKYRWEEGFVTETVRPEKIGIDPRGTDELKNCEFIYEIMEDKIGDLIKKYPKKKKALIAKYGADKMKSKVSYIEFWGGEGEWFAHKLDNIILNKKKNPNFDYTNPENNLFKKPQFPYLILNVFNLGKNLYDDTSLIENVILLQDAVNKRKNQISDLTDENKKLIVASSAVISKEEFQKFIDKYGMIGIWLDSGGDIKSGLQIVGGTVDNAIFNDMGHSITEIDNIMGTHSTTRGERAEQETLGGRQLLTAADYGRTDTIVIKIEQLVENWFNAYLHMFKVYSLEDAEFSNGEETVNLSKEEIPRGTMVIIKKGSSLPVDREGRAELAVKLAQFNFVDPETLFTELGYGKEQERTQKLYEWLQMTGKIVPQQPQMPAGGQPGASQGQQQAQLARLEQIMTSSKFQALPDEQKQVVINEARQVAEAIKGGIQ